MQLICAQADALRNAKALAFEVGCADLVEFGFPVVWTAEHALLYLPSGALDPNVDHIPECGPTLSLLRKDAIIHFASSCSGSLHLQDVPQAVERSSGIQSRRGLLQCVACPCVDKPIIASYFDKTASLVFAVRVASIVNSRVNNGKGLSDAISCAVITSRVRKWLADTGCGHDLVDKDEIKGLTSYVFNSADPLRLFTANGETPANKQIRFKIPEIKEIIQPYVLAKTPNVLSIGRRCVDHGYSFVWEALSLIHI